jgi:hypothetical protein
MRVHNPLLTIAAAAVACVILTPATSLAATITYEVTADTSSIAGTSGYLDLQLEPGPMPANLVTASVSGFTTDGALNGSATLSGDVFGQLPGTLTFDNQTTFNDYFQSMTFQNTAMFFVTLNGPTPIGGGPSAFNIGFYASDQSTALLTTSPDGIAGQIVINPDGSTTPATFPSSEGQPSVLTITVATVSAVPEPDTFTLAGIALALLARFGHRQRQLNPDRIADGKAGSDRAWRRFPSSYVLPSRGWFVRM